jgi:hypothetical protein
MMVSIVILKKDNSTVMCQAMQNVKHPSYLSCLDTCGVEIETSLFCCQILVHASRMEIYSSACMDIISVEDGPNNKRQRVTTW